LLEKMVLRRERDYSSSSYKTIYEVPTKEFFELLASHVSNNPPPC
jgi:prophage maintenance system killer protein